MGCGASADNDNILGRESRSRATSYVPSSMLHEGSVAAAACTASCSPAASSLGGDSTATKSTDGEQLRRAKAAASRMIDAPPEEATTRKALKMPEPRLFSPHSVSLAATIVIVVTDDETKAESSNRSSTAAASESNPLSPPRRAPLTADSLKELQRVLEEQDHAPR